MFRLVKYLKGYVKESIIGPFFKLLEACFELAVPIVVAKMIDVGIKNEDNAYILWMGLVLVLFAVLGLACSFTAQYFAAKASVGFGTALRKKMFAHINALSHTELDTIGTPSLITRTINDINQTQTGVNMVLRLFLRSPFIVAGSLILAFTINVKLAMIFLIATPIIFAVIMFIMYATIPMYKNIQKKTDRVSLLVRENLSGARTVRAFSKQADELEIFGETSKELAKKQIFVGRISNLLNPVTYVIVNLAVIAIIRMGADSVNTGVLTQGEVIALVNYMFQIFYALSALSILIMSFTKSVASASRVNEVLDMKPSLENTGKTEFAPKGGEIVRFDNVSFAYHGSGENSLEGISFSVMRGETVGIIGGTGSGKSTLINLIPRFYDITGGSLRIDGIDIKEYDTASLRSKIGIVPQKAVLFAGTVRENMRWGKADATDEEIWRALEIAQARSFIEEDGLDKRVEQGGKNLSGGQRQRLTIARAIIGHPEILILDDSTSALDYATDAALRRALADHTENTTTFIVSQRVSSIRQADKIVVLDDGALVGVGTHEELLERCEIYREIYSSQIPGGEVDAK